MSKGKEKQKKRKQARKDHYLQGLGKVLPPGLYSMEVQHDDWCPKLKGGVCCCDPDFKRVKIG